MSSSFRVEISINHAQYNPVRWANIPILWQRKEKHRGSSKLFNNTHLEAWCALQIQSLRIGSNCVKTKFTQPSFLRSWDNSSPPTYPQKCGREEKMAFKQNDKLISSDSPLGAWKSDQPPAPPPVSGSDSLFPNWVPLARSPACLVLSVRSRKRR